MGLGAVNSFRIDVFPVGVKSTDDGTWDNAAESKVSICCTTVAAHAHRIP